MLSKWTATTSNRKRRSSNDGVKSQWALMKKDGNGNYYQDYHGLSSSTNLYFFVFPHYNFMYQLKHFRFVKNKINSNQDYNPYHRIFYRKYRPFNK